MLSNHVFEELAMDAYDEVDRRETDAIWNSLNAKVNTKSINVGTFCIQCHHLFEQFFFRVLVLTQAYQRRVFHFYQSTLTTELQETKPAKNLQDSTRRNLRPWSLTSSKRFVDAQSRWVAIRKVHCGKFLQVFADRNINPFQLQ